MRKTKWEWPRRCSAAMVGQVFGVSAQAVGMWRECPRNGDGTWDLRAVLEWRESAAVLKALERAGLDKDKEAGGKALERQREAQAALAELELAEKCGLVVFREDVDRQVKRAFGQVKIRVEGWPGIVAGLVCDKPVSECREVLTRQGEELLRQLKEDVENIGGDEVEGEDE